MRSIAIMLLMMFSSATSAATINIDFESVPLGTEAPLTIDGFLFDAPTALVPVISDAPGGGQRLEMGALGYTDSGGNAGPISFEMTRTDGLSFAYLSGDVTGGGAYFGGGVSVIGTKTGGGIATDPIGTGDWLDLVKVTFSVSSSGPPSSPEVLIVTADNITVSVVPIPAAAWLFGSALAGLGWMRRKRLV